MDSSDDSFAWTNASNSSEESDLMNMTNSQQDESDAEYKKMLHKQLFEDPDDSEVKVKRELLNSLKREPESEADSTLDNNISPKKKANKKNETKVKQEFYDEVSVKNELIADTFSKKSKDIYSGGEDDPDDLKPKAKKKKSKRKRQSSVESNKDSLVSNNQKSRFEESVVDSKPHKRKLSFSNNVNGTEEETESTSPKKKKRKKKNKKEEVELATEPILEENHLINDKSLLCPSYTSRISDNIQFEEETKHSLKGGHKLQFDTSSSVATTLKRFMNKNAHLHPETCMSEEEPFISQDDEVWLIKCPTEIEIESLVDNNLTLDNKCKIKVSNQTYIGNLVNEINRLPVLLFENNNAIIKNLALCGVIKLHNKIPKAHILQDNPMLNNQTDFIALPETKCRHPLFGPDYKKAIKIRSSVKVRLADANTTVSLNDEKKKRKNKTLETGRVKDEESSQGVTARKRKPAAAPAGDEADALEPKKRRRIKEPESVNTWDSEKAIEENLFNF